jgi:hypothetical protein
MNRKDTINEKAKLIEAMAVDLADTVSEYKILSKTEDYRLRGKVGSSKKSIIDRIRLMRLQLQNLSRMVNKS